MKSDPNLKDALGNTSLHYIQLNQEGNFKPKLWKAGARADTGDTPY